MAFLPGFLAQQQSLSKGILQRRSLQAYCLSSASFVLALGLFRFSKVAFEIIFLNSPECLETHTLSTGVRRWLMKPSSEWGTS
jgi:hypothetical protein